MKLSRIKVILWSAVLASLTLAVLSCSDDECTLNCNGELRFPLGIGYSWQYQAEFRYENFRPDVDTVTWNPEESIKEYFITIDISLSDTLDDGTIVYALHEVVSRGNTIESEGDSWYANHPDGLYHYYTRTSPGTTMFNFKPVTGSGLLNAAEFTSKSFEYPLREGLQWECTNGVDYGPVGAVYKNVIGIGEQHVPAGKYECYAIGWTWEKVSGVERTEYLADDGIIRILDRAKDIRLTNYEHPSAVGTADHVIEITLLRSPFQ